MNNRPIDTARDPDLRHSYQALLRAAKRAREVAVQTGTLIVISRNGVVELLDPAIKQTLEHRIDTMQDAGMLRWSGRRLMPRRPTVRIAEGGRTVADLLIGDRR